MKGYNMNRQPGCRKKIQEIKPKSLSVKLEKRWSGRREAGECVAIKRCLTSLDSYIYPIPLSRHSALGNPCS
jgi:hypothetical protein